MVPALVIGYGSIGQRHARILGELGCDVALVTKQTLVAIPRFSSVGEAVRVHAPEYVVVATETARHAQTVEELSASGFRGRLLVEKPLGDGLTCDRGDFALAAVGYNLRFHPVLVELAGQLRRERVISAEIYCGQHLPAWRPGTDFRRGYSASAVRGGGVLRDLSHELDYMLWLFGAWRRLAALGGKLSALDISSDDCWAILAELDRCQACTLHINYVDVPGRRRLTVNTEAHTYFADISAGSLIVDGTPLGFSVSRDDTYIAQHRAMLSGSETQICNLNSAKSVMTLISAVERAATSRSWVTA